MKIKYNGPSPLLHHSAPSGAEYMFMPGEETTILKEDKTFYTNMANAAGSSFELCGVAKTVKEVNDIVTDLPNTHWVKSQIHAFLDSKGIGYGNETKAELIDLANNKEEVI
ncbi:hypothetical protein KA005_49475 [bacterium]|nr:hypothetical protein [bacterium]